MANWIRALLAITIVLATDAWSIDAEKKFVRADAGGTRESASAAATEKTSASRPSDGSGYGRTIVISEPTSATSRMLSPAIADLERYLTIMTGVGYRIGTASSKSAITLMLSASPSAPHDAVKRLDGKGIDSFLIRGDDSRLEIIANDERGLVNGIYFYLESLGVRWLLPGEKWTSVRTRSKITLIIDRLVEPAYKAREYAGTGGFHSWRWGRRYSGSALLESRTLQWKRRLRYGGEYLLGKSTGEAFIADKEITPILARHPEYLAKIGDEYSPLYTKNQSGKTVLNVTAKLNATEPEAIALFCGWTLENFKSAHKSADKRLHQVVSVEPSDGYGYGDNVSQLPGNGSGSDQSFHIANECAKTVRKEFPGARVILLAYAGHAEPPSFPLEPNVIVQVTPYAFQGEPPEIFIARWKEKAASLAIYDYWSIPDWSHDEPVFDYLSIANRLRYWRANNIEGVNAESTYGAGAMGLGHYVASHVMWDISLNERALIEEWYDRAFGTAKQPMKQMLERWARSFRLTSAELGASFRDIDEAEQLAAADSAVVDRVDDFARYLHYLRLRLEIANASDEGTKSRLAAMLAEHLFSINDSSMVHTTRIVDLDTRAYPSVAAMFDLGDPNSPGPGWARVHPLSHEEVAALIADGRKSYATVDWVEKTYSGDLRFLRTPNWSEPKNDSWGSIMPTVGDLDLDLEVPTGLDKFPLRVTRLVDNEISIFDTGGRDVFRARIGKTSANGLSTWDELIVPLAAGRYRVHFHPAGGRAGGYFRFQTWKGVPVILRSFLSPKNGSSPRLYFYVPHGLEKIAMFYPYGDYNGVFGFQVLDPKGNLAAMEFRDNRRVIEVAVPTGEDGKIWSLNRSVSPDLPFRMLNVPQTFSLSPEALMVPSDALMTQSHGAK